MLWQHKTGQETRTQSGQDLCQTVDDLTMDFDSFQADTRSK